MHLTEVQDGYPYGYGLVELDDRLVPLRPHQMFANLVLPLVGGVGYHLLHSCLRGHQLEVHVVLHALHGLAVRGVVHQHEKILLEVRLSLLPLARVEVYVGLEPSALFELDAPVYASQLQAHLQVELQGCHV